MPLVAKARKLDALWKTLTRIRYKGSIMGDCLFGTAASMVPQAGMSGVATIAPIIVGAVLENAGIRINTKVLVHSLPGNDTIANMVVQNAADSIILTKESIQMNPMVYISCDKGNKKGNKNLAKYLCWYCVKENKVKKIIRCRLHG